MFKKISGKKSVMKRTVIAPKASKKKTTAAPAPAPSVEPTVPTVAETAALLEAVVKPTVSVPTLISGLRDPSADVARDAAVALGRTGDSAAVEPLIAVIVNADDYYHSVVRAAAAESLGILGDPRAVEPLIVASRDTMAEASAEAVRALAILGDRRAVSPLIDIVRNSYGFFLPIVRRAAVLALAKLGGPEATAELKAVSMNTDEDQVIRQAATRAIV